MRVAMVAVLLLLPAAAAAPEPALYFLKDGEIPLAGPGILNGTAPDSLDPSVGLVTVGTSDLPSKTFATIDGPHPDRLLGPLFVGLWVGPSAVVEGNLTATLYLDDGVLTPLASAGVALSINTSNVPDPTAFVPPDPTDPEAAAAYIAAQALLALYQPPVLLQLGFVDVEVPEGAELTVGFYLEAADGASLPIPVGVVGSVQYDGALMPSFVYAPWYATDPEPTTTTTSAPPTTTTSTSTSRTQTTLGPGDGESEDSPLPVIPIVALLGLLALRRRLA